MKKKIPPNNEPREYFGKIDFTSEHENWGMRGIFMLHMKRHLVVALVDSLTASDCDNFEISVRPNFGMGCNRCVTLACRTCIDNDMAESIDMLLSFCDTGHVDICYKEGSYGYTIDGKGRVLKKWPTDDGMC